MYFGYKKEETYGLCDLFITNLSIVRTRKRIKDKKCYVHNIFTTLS